MLAGMVGVRHPQNIKQAREATEAYLKKLQETHPLLDVLRLPAGRPSGTREAIPYFFAWSLVGPTPAPASSAPAPIEDVPPAPAVEEAPAPAFAAVVEEPTAAPEPEGRQVVFVGEHVIPPAAYSAESPPAVPPRPSFKPFKPLRTRPVACLSPKVGSRIDVSAALPPPPPSEDAGVELGPPGLRTEYQMAFAWPDLTVPLRAEVKPVDTNTRANVFPGPEDITPLPPPPPADESSTGDHLWALLVNPPPNPPPTTAPARPSTDQLWDLLLQPIEAPALPSPPPPPQPAEPALLEAASVASTAAAIPPTTTRPPATRKSSKPSQKAAAAAGPPTLRPKRRKQKGARKTTSSSYTYGTRLTNPLLLNPRYPPERSSRDLLTTEYRQSFVWPSVPALAHSIG